MILELCCFDDKDIFSFVTGWQTKQAGSHTSVLLRWQKLCHKQRKSSERISLFQTNVFLSSWWVYFSFPDDCIFLLTTCNGFVWRVKAKSGKVRALEELNCPWLQKRSSTECWVTSSPPIANKKKIRIPKYLQKKCKCKEKIKKT